MAGGDAGTMRGAGEPWLPEGRQGFTWKLRQLAAPVVQDRGVRLLPTPGAAPLLLLPLRFLASALVSSLALPARSSWRAYCSRSFRSSCGILRPSRESAFEGALKRRRTVVLDQSIRLAGAAQRVPDLGLGEPAARRHGGEPEGRLVEPLVPLALPGGGELESRSHAAPARHRRGRADRRFPRLARHAGARRPAA